MENQKEVLAWMLSLEKLFLEHRELMEGIRDGKEIEPLDSLNDYCVHLYKGLKQLSEASGIPVMARMQGDGLYRRNYIIHNGIEYFQLEPLQTAR